MKNTNKKIIKIGSYSVGLTAILIAVVIAFNLLIGQLPVGIIHPDFTNDELLTFGDETKKLVSKLEDEVTMYLVAQEGYKDMYLSELLSRYTAENSRITVKTVDPIENPMFLSKYTSTNSNDNTVVVESEKRFTVIDGNDFYMYEPVGYEGTMLSYDEYAYVYQMYAQQGMTLSVNEYFCGEKELSGAIDYVTSDIIPVIYTVTGHGETSVGTYFTSAALEENVEIKELNLVSGEEIKVPDDAKAIIVNSPASDISENELEALKKYLQAGGSIILTTTPQSYTAEKFPNLASLTSFMGVTAENGLVVEGDTDKFYYSKDLLLPDISRSGLLAEYPENYALYMPVSHPIVKTDVENRTVTELLLTSASAYIYDENDKEGANAEKKSFAVAVQAEIAKTDENEGGGRLVWFSSAYAFSDAMYTQIGIDPSANILAFVEIVKNICGKVTSINVIGKVISSAVLSVTEQDNLIFSSLYVIVIPLVVLIIGFAMWFSRRRK